MEKMFINTWHNMSEIKPEDEEIWFLLDGTILVGKYIPESNKIVVADGDELDADKVYQWRCMDDKNVSGYPQEHEVVSVFIPEIGISAIGTYTGHYVDLSNGNDVMAVLLYSGYQFEGTSDNSVAWTNVHYWYHLPSLPEVVVTDDETYYKDTSIECDKFTRMKKLFLDDEPHPIDDKCECDCTTEEQSKVEDGKSAIQSYKVNNN